MWTARDADDETIALHTTLVCVFNKKYQKSETCGRQRQQATKKVDATAKDLKNSTHVFSRSLKQSPLTPDNLEKVQSDRYRRCFIVLCIPMRRILTCKMCVSVQKRHNICVVVNMYW